VRRGAALSFTEPNEVGEVKRPDAMGTNQWHVRPSTSDAGGWDVWLGEGIVATERYQERAWEMAKAEARKARGQAFLYYQRRSEIRVRVDYKNR
jgi:hypothetical protein